MFDVQIGGKTVKAEVTFYTAQLYEMEFQSDMLRDILGVQERGGAVELEFEEVDGESVPVVAKIDFTKVSWSAVMKALWAAIKTADPMTPSYAQWAKETSGLNLWDLNGVIGDEISDCFFRSEAAGEEAPEED